MLKKLIYILIIFHVAIAAKAQQKSDDDLVQFSGVVLSYDSNKTIPFATISIKGSRRGSYSDMAGYFSFVAKRSDVIVFSCIGYKSRAFKFPEGMQEAKFNVIIPMEEDTFALPDVTLVAPYPSREEFDYYFVKNKIPDDQLSLAYRNLRKRPEEYMENLRFDATENARWALREQAVNQANTTGQLPTFRILDPIAWSKFIRALENGDLKRK